jgi:peptide-methionine (S)-S-oxide reductase
VSARAGQSGVSFRRAAILLITALFLSFALIAQPLLAQAEEPVRLPAPADDPADPRDRAVAILAGGCFWGVEGVFAHVDGVIRVESGYHGGSAATATYDQTNDGTTGHAEAVRITYDPRRVSYGTLLHIFFSVVTNPTEFNRQGPDIGSQYRNAIVPLTPQQRQTAGRYILQLGRGRHWRAPIVTRIETARRFYPAEDYHQDFMRRNPDHPYIRRWDAPKLAAFRAFFPALYRANPAP